MKLLAQNLPEELIEEILLRLPVRPLLKVRCVCKSWYSLLSSEQFMESHLNIYGKESGKGIIIASYYPCKVINHCSLNSGVITSADFGFPMNEPVEFFDIIGTSNGLICIIVNQRSIWLWNPSTRKSKILPEMKNKFPPNMSCGFGFDELNRDYKVVVTKFGPVDGYKRVTQVYSLKSNSWRSTEVFHSDLPLDREGRFVVGGKLYFGLGVMPQIVSFNLTTEIWEKMVFLYETSCPWIHGGVHEACRSIKSCIQNTRTVFWILKYDGCRVKKCRSKAFQINAKWFSSSGLISFEPNDSILFVTIEDGKLCSMKRNLSASVMRDSHPLYEAYSYVESLVPLIE